MKLLAPAIAIAALVGGCNKVTGIVFTVDASGPVSGIARLHGTATLNGGNPAAIDLSHSPAVSIPPTTTFAIQLPDSAAGTVAVQLQALAADGTVLASGGGSATIIAHGVQRNATVTLTPTGSGLVFDATTHDFGTVELAKSSAPFTFTATNMGMDQSGTPMVTIDGTNAGDFTFSTADCSNPVAAAGTCTIDVTFSPTAAGARSATLHLAATPGGEATATLTGTGMMPSGAAFSIAPKTFLFNDTAEMMTGNSNTFTVTNIGAAASPTLGSSMIAGGMNTSYTITTDGCFAKVLMPNDTCMVTVQFKPVAAGMQTTTLSVAGAGATLNGRGVGTWHAEGNMHGGPGPGTFWYGAFAPAVDEIMATDGQAMYVTTGGTPPVIFQQFGIGKTTSARANGVWGPARGSVYVVDSTGEVLHYNGSGTGFSIINSGALLGAGNGCCSGIWGFSDTSFFVVGASTVARYDGSFHGETINATGTINLLATWGTAANNMFAVGKGGLVVHRDATGTWQQQTSGTTFDLNSISGSSASDIYAVGASTAQVPIILHFDGTSWSPQNSGKATGEFNTVWVAPDGEAWIGDLLGPLLHSDGDGTWADVTPPGNLEKWQITGSSDHDVYLFAEDGNIFHYY